MGRCHECAATFSSPIAPAPRRRADLSGRGVAPPCRLGRRRSADAGWLPAAPAQPGERVDYELLSNQMNVRGSTLDKSATASA